MGKEIIGAAIQLAGADDIVARFGDALNGISNGRHAGRYAKRSDTAFHCRDALFQHVSRWIHNARVDITRDLQVKQVGTVLRIIKGEGGC